MYPNIQPFLSQLVCTLYANSSLCSSLWNSLLSGSVLLIISFWYALAFFTTSYFCFLFLFACTFTWVESTNCIFVPMKPSCDACKSTLLYVLIYNKMLLYQRFNTVSECEKRRKFLKFLPLCLHSETAYYKLFFEFFIFERQIFFRKIQSIFLLSPIYIFVYLLLMLDIWYCLILLFCFYHSL